MSETPPLPPEIREELDRLNEFIRPGVEYRWRLGCLLPRPYKVPRPRPSHFNKG